MRRTRIVGVAGLLLLLGAVGAALWFAMRRDDAGTRTPPGDAHGTTERDAAAPSRSRSAGTESAAPTAAAEPSGPPRRPATFLGRVLDPGGAPVEGAAVTVTATADAPSPTTTAPPGDAPTAASTTDAAGTFRVTLPLPPPVAATTPPRAEATVAVSAPGFVAAVADHAQEDRPVTIRLVAEGVLTGRVLDLAAKPVAGARVTCVRILGVSRVDVTEATTGADGTYRVAGLDWSPVSESTTWPVLLDVRAAGFAARQLTGPFPRRGETMRHDVVLVPARPLEVLVVLDDGSGHGDLPVEGAAAFLDAAGGSSGSDELGRAVARSVPAPAPHLAAGTTDANGRCVLGDAPSYFEYGASIAVRAWKDGFVPGTTSVQQRKDAADERVVVRIRPAGTVRGRVVDAAGGPVEGATVGAFGAGPPWPAPLGDTTGRAVTGPDGGYLLTGVPSTADASARVTIRASPPRRLPDGRVFRASATAQISVQPKAGAETAAPDIVFPAPSAPCLGRLTVVDRGGTPVAGARVRSEAIGRTVRTDDDGRAELCWDPVTVGSRSGDAPIEVTAPGFATAALRCRPVAAAPVDVRVVLDPPSRLAGIVRAPDGAPVAGAWVEARRADAMGWSSNTTTGADGTFAFDELPAVPFTVSVSTASSSRPVLGTKWCRRAYVEAAVPGGPPLEIALEPEDPSLGALVVTVVDAAGGAPVFDALVTCRCGNESREEESATSDVAGVADLARVPEGTFDLEVEAAGRVRETISVTIVRGETARARVAVSRGSAFALRLAVEGDTADALRRASSVRAFRIDLSPGEPGAGLSAGARRPQAGDAPDRWTFDALPRGTYRLTVRRPSRGSANPPLVSTGTFDVAPSAAGTPEATVTLVPAGTLAFDVASAEEGAPPAPPCRVTLEVVAADGGARHFVAVASSVGAVGRIELLPGSYVVRCRIGTGDAHEAGVTIRAGEVAVLAVAEDGTMAPR